MSERDLPQAKRVLYKHHEVEESATDGCPRCKSCDIRYDLFYLLPIYLFWLPAYYWFGGLAALFLLKRKWHCCHCGLEWREPPAESAEAG